MTNDKRLVIILAALLVPAAARADAPVAPPVAAAGAPAGGPAAAVSIDVGGSGADQALDDVVVLSAKRPQPLREAAANTSVITSADLAAYGWRDFAEAVTSLAGFLGTSPGDNSVYLGVRGVSLQGDTNGRVLILVDGHTQNELWSHSAYTTQLGLDASMIDHIEVLRGPASSLYGSLGFLAILNIVTRRGAADSWARASFDLGNASAFRLAASVGHRFGSGLEFGLSASGLFALGESYRYPDFDYFLQNPPTGSASLLGNRCPTCAGPSALSTPATDAAQGVAVYGHLDYKGFSVRASYQWLDKHIPFAPYGSVFDSTVNHYLVQRAYLDAAYEAGRPETAQFTLRLYGDYAGYLDDLRNPATAASMGMPGAPEYTFHDEANPWWVGADAKLYLARDWKVLRGSFTIGGDITYLVGNDTSGPVGDAAADLAPRTSLSQAILFGSIYGQAELAWGRAAALTLGLRGDFADRYTSEASPRFGLVLFPGSRPDWTSTVKLLYAHGFVHPSWYQTFFDDGQTILHNYNLRPERADNYEVVFAQQLSRPLTLTLAGFYIHGSGIIEQATVCADGTAALSTCPDPAQQRQQAQNARSFDSRGAEVTLSGRFRSGLRFYANYALTVATNTLADGTQPTALNAPLHQAKAGLSVPLWRNHLFVGAEVRAFSERQLVAQSSPYKVDPSAPTHTDPYALVSANVAWRDLPRGLSLLLRVDNLLGQTWYEPSVAEQSAPILRIPHSGPSLIARLAYEF